MAGITQQIPNYIFGMSEQPDELKIPGQVSDLVNGLPDVTKGLSKRPGSELLNTIAPTYSFGGHWFNIDRDENEQYIGVVQPDGRVQVWDVLSGQEKNVFPNSLSYLSNTNSEDIQVLTVQDTTYITNRKEVVKMTSPVAEMLQYESYITLDQVKPGTQYALDIANNPKTTNLQAPYWRATNIQIVGTPYDRTADYIGEGKVEYAGRQLFGDESNRLSTEPKNFWFEIDCRGAVGGPEPEDGGDGESFYDLYTNTATLKFGGENTPVGYRKEVTMINSTKPGQWIVEVTEAILVTPEVDRALIRPEPTPFEGLGATADSILASVQKELKYGAQTAQIIGNGIFVQDNTPISITAPDPTLFTIIQESCNDVSELPGVCKNGFVVKVSNSGEEEDDYYVKFIGDNGQDGTGVWEETYKPTFKGDRDQPLLLELDSTTMPVSLTRLPSGDFSLTPILWDPREVGDEVTNPEPSFVDSTINKMVFYKNRLGMISGENIVLSRAGDYYNFFVKTATTVTTIDPIDTSCSSQTPAILYEAIEVPAGLILFAENQQFLLTSYNDVFGPRSAKINALSTYKFNIRTNPVSLGTSIGFLSDGNNRSRFFEMVGITGATEPQVIEQSKLVSTSITSQYFNIAESKENSFLALADINSPTVWVYKFFNSGEKRIQSAWGKWELPGNIEYHCIMSDVYYAIVNNLGDFTLQAIRLNLDLQPSEGVYLDCKSYLSVATYDAANNETTFTNISPAYVQINPAKLRVVSLYDPLTPSPGLINYKVSKGTIATPTFDPAKLTLKLKGDWTESFPVLGISYKLVVQFPTIYAQKTANDSVRSDIRSSLIIHRVKLNLEDIHQYDTILSRRGKQPYRYTHESSVSDSYKANNMPFLRNEDETISIYERNTNMSLTLESDFPKSCTLVSLNWEGDYNPRYYKSV